MISGLIPIVLEDSKTPKNNDHHHGCQGLLDFLCVKNKDESLEDALAMKVSLSDNFKSRVARAKKKHKTSKKQIIIRDIVVGLFHLAGIEEDEDLLYSCTEDVRSNIDG